MQSLSRTMQCGWRCFKSPPEVLLRQAARSDGHVLPVACRHVTTPCRKAGTYRAAQCTELSKPLQLQDVPSKAQLTKGEVRVAVNSASVNFGDLLTIQGQYQEKPTLPFIPGSELSGKVTEVGPDVEQFKVGDHVAGLSTAFGAFAQEIVMNKRSVVPLPDGIESNKAASYLVSYGTAYMALKLRAGIKEGDTVLVTAAAGATGLACVELASKIFKAKVIGACGGPEKCALVKEKGAADCIDYNTESIRDRVKDITGGKGVDIVIENVGGKIMEQCFRSLAFEGRLVVVGFASGDIPQIPSNILMVKSCSVLGVYWGSYSHRKPRDFLESIMTTTQLLQEGKINPHISRVFDLEKVNDAFDFIRSRKSTGKVVIKMR